MIGCIFPLSLQIREDVKTGVYVENLKEVEVKSVHDVVQLLIQVSSLRWNPLLSCCNPNCIAAKLVLTCLVYPFSGSCQQESCGDKHEQRKQQITQRICVHCRKQGLSLSHTQFTHLLRCLYQCNEQRFFPLILYTIFCVMTFCLVLMQWEKDALTNIRFGRLNLVDLAGSERFDSLITEALVVQNFPSSSWLNQKL